MYEDYYFPTDPIYEQDCTNCIYAYTCTAVGKCPIGGPYYEEDDPDLDEMEIVDESLV